MKHLGTVKLETDRLILRRMYKSDAFMMFENYAKDEEICRYLPWEAHESIDDTNRILEFYENKIDDDDFYWWGIVLKENNQLFGYVMVLNSDEDTSTMEIEYCTGRGFWNHHYTTEALRTAIKFLFDEVGARKITASHHVNNAHSGRVMKRCGFVYVGDSYKRYKNHESIFRNYELNKGEFYKLLENLEESK